MTQHDVGDARVRRTAYVRGLRAHSTYAGAVPSARVLRCRSIGPVYLFSGLRTHAEWDCRLSQLVEYIVWDVPGLTNE